ncbi:class I SAM-dependent methyltransferase [Lysobacter sp. CA199]|uniref:class I SAM-dependent methyltransferase n=1 Tax=Lysobacter sp. CA199 TaxID=3455608 RepID=UPI003F8D7F5E
MSGDFDASYTAYQTDRSALRRIVRRAYLRSAAAQLHGPTLDFGCGVGELLERLPAGSKGLEYNLATVAHCRARGLDVEAYDGYADDWKLTALHGARFESMVISHVLEHLDEPAAILRRLLTAARGLGIGRVLAIVPGQAGYRIDATHRTFVDRAMLSTDEVVAGTGFKLARSRYFPGDLRGIGDWFAHHELQALFLAAA